VSRIGKKPVQLPSGVSAAFSGRELVVSKGNVKLTQWVDPAIDVSIANGSIVFDRKSDDRRHKQLHGLYRAIANNMVDGLVKPFEKRLQIVGVGFGAKVLGKDYVEMTLGFANAIKVKIPAGITVTTPDATNIVITGADRQKVGQLAAELRKLRKPEPYKGKGVRYIDEVVKRKAGKAVGAGAGG
jgi:large subunit ribosomal protein L6